MNHLDTFFTPFTADNFLMSCVSWFWSSIITVSVPEKSPSSDDWMLMPRIITFYSLLRMEVILFTIPMSSCPTTLSVTGYCFEPLPAQRARSTR